MSFHENEIACGGTCLVYLRTYESGQSEVVKKLLPKFLGRPEFFNLLRREHEILKQVVHPLIVRSLRLEESHPSAHLVLEAVEGKALSQFETHLSNLTNEQRKIWALRLLAQLQSVLSHLQDKGIVHGDICPDNILIQTNGFIKLIDFSTARHESEPAHSFQVAGKAAFRAPELKQSGRTSLVGDIYAIGRCFEQALGIDLMDQAPFPEMIQSLCEKRQLVRLSDFGFSDGIAALNPLPEAEFWEVKVRVYRRTQLLKENEMKKFRIQFSAAAALLLILFAHSSFLPQRGRVSINTLPYSKVAFDIDQGRLSYETPIKELNLPAGNWKVEFLVPGRKNKIVSHNLKLLPGEHVKIFEEF